jgi:hypothetical protein
VAVASAGLGRSGGRAGMRGGGRDRRCRWQLGQRFDKRL